MNIILNNPAKYRQRERLASAAGNPCYKEMLSESEVLYVLSQAQPGGYCDWSATSPSNTQQPPVSKKRKAD